MGKSKSNEKPNKVKYWELLDTINQYLNIPNYDSVKAQYKTTPFGHLAIIQTPAFMDKLLEFENIAFDPTASNSKIVATTDQLTLCLQSLHNLLEGYSKLDGAQKFDSNIVDIVILIVALTSTFFIEINNRFSVHMNRARLNENHNLETNQIDIDRQQYHEFLLRFLDFQVLLERLSKPESISKHARHFNDAACAERIARNMITALPRFSSRHFDEKKFWDKVSLIKKYKRQLPAWCYYATLSQLYFSYENYNLSRIYLNKYKAIVDLNSIEQVEVLSSINFFAANRLLEDVQITTNDEHRIAILRDACMRHKEAIKYMTLQCKMVIESTKPSLSNENDAVIVQLLQSYIEKCQKALRENEAQIIMLKGKLISQIKAVNTHLEIVMQDHEDTVGDKSIVISLESAEKAQQLFTACIHERISGFVDKEVNPCQVIIHSTLNTSFTRLIAALKRADIQLEQQEKPSVQKNNNNTHQMSNNSNNQNVESNTNNSNNQFIADNTNNEPTKTQKKKNKKLKNTKLAEPTLREKILEEQKNKPVKAPKVIIWPGSNGEPDYVYNEEDEESTGVFKLNSDSNETRRHFVRVHDDLNQVLSAKQFKNERQRLDYLLDNHTVKSNSHGHSCFVISNKPFKEFFQQPEFNFGKKPVEEPKEPNLIKSKPKKSKSKSNHKKKEAVNNNNAESNLNAPDTYIKGKSFKEQFRFIGSSTRRVQKAGDPDKIYTLTEIYGLKLTKAKK